MKKRHLYWGIIFILFSVVPLFAQKVVPNPPRQLTAISEQDVDGTYKVILSWYIDKGNSSNYVFPDGFKIYQSTYNKNIVKTELIGSVPFSPNQYRYEFTINGLPKGTYEFYVTAFKGDAQSLPSNKVVLQLYYEQKFFVKIISNPPLFAYVGKNYVYQVVASSNIRCPLAYELVGSVPEGMKISSTGLIEWVPEQPGKYEVKIKVSVICDVNIEPAYQQYQVLVYDSVPPNGKPYLKIVSMPPTKAIVGVPYNYKVITETNVYCVVKFKILNSNIDKIFIDEGTGLINWVPNKAGTFEFSVMAYLLCDSNVFDIQKVTVNVQNYNENKNCVHLIGEATFVDGTPVPNGIAFAWKLDEKMDPGNAYFKTPIRQGYFEFYLPSGVYVFEFSGELFEHQFYAKASSLNDATKVPLDCEQTPEKAIKVLLTKKPEPVLYSVSGVVLSAVDNTPVPSIIEFLPVELIFATNKRENISNIPQFMTKTDTEGKYEISLPNNFSYIAHAIPLDKSKYLDQYYYLASSPYNADILVPFQDLDDVNFYLMERQKYQNGFSGVVVDKDRNPIEARVFAILVQPTGNDYKQQNTTIMVVETNKDGHFLFQNLPFGKYVLLSVPKDKKYTPGYYKANDFATLKWREASQIEVGEFMIQIVYEIKHRERLSLKGLVSVSGYIEEKTGITKILNEPQCSNPISEALVCALDKDGNVLDYYITGKDGYFKLEDLVPVELRIYVSKVGYEDAELFVDADYETNFQFFSEIKMEKAISLVESTKNLGISISHFGDNLFINAEPETEIFSIKLYDLFGKLAIEENEMLNYPVQIRLNSLSSGVYIVCVVTNKGVDYFRISIVR